MFSGPRILAKDPENLEWKWYAHSRIDEMENFCAIFQAHKLTYGQFFEFLSVKILFGEDLPRARKPYSFSTICKIFSARDPRYKNPKKFILGGSKLRPYF